MPLNTEEDYRQLGEHLFAIDAPLASFADAHGYKVLPAYYGGRYPNRRITQEGLVCRTIHISMSQQPNGTRFDHFFPEIPYTIFGGAWIDDPARHKRLSSPFLQTRAIPFSLFVATLPAYLDTFHDFLARITPENIYAYACFSPLGEPPENLLALKRVYSLKPTRPTEKSLAMPETQTLERPDTITFKGEKVTLVGKELKVGDHAPDFTLAATDLAPTTFADLSDNHQKAVLIIMVPSIDTSVCSIETGKFNKHVASLPASKIKVVTVSADTPFAQKRWAKDEGVDNIQMLSDHKDRAFADAFGVRIKELGLLARAIYLVDKTGVIRYIQTVPEVATEPDYDEVLKAAHALADG